MPDMLFTASMAYCSWEIAAFRRDAVAGDRQPLLPDAGARSGVGSGRRLFCDPVAAAKPLGRKRLRRRDPRAGRLARTVGTTGIGDVKAIRAKIFNRALDPDMMSDPR